jgi:hypothetical protein
MAMSCITPLLPMHPPTHPRTHAPTHPRTHAPTHPRTHTQLTHRTPHTTHLPNHSFSCWRLTSATTGSTEQRTRSTSCGQATCRITLGAWCLVARAHLFRGCAVCQQHQLAVVLSPQARGLCACVPWYLVCRQGVLQLLHRPATRVPAANWQRLLLLPPRSLHPHRTGTAASVMEHPVPVLGQC